MSAREKCAVLPVNQTEWSFENVSEFVILGLGVNEGRAGHYTDWSKRTLLCEPDESGSILTAPVNGGHAPPGDTDNQRIY